MAQGFSIHEKLLLAALELTQGGKVRFSAEDLVVMAWKMYPEAFGLAGYTDNTGQPIYPNSNRVYAEIMGSKPLRKSGFVRKVGSKMYKLTEAGLTRANALDVGKQDVKVTKSTLAREHSEHLRRLFDSKAAVKYRNTQNDDISFFDACGFWGISAGSKAKELWDRFADFENLLASALQSIGNRKSVSFKHGSAEFTAEDLKVLETLHEFLQEKYKEEIQHIKGRIHDYER